MWYLKLVDKGIIPDSLIKLKIKHLIKQRLQSEKKQFNIHKLVEELKESPIAVKTNEANVQHYELPVSFFNKILGQHLKYSCGLWLDNETCLNNAEKCMLDKTIERADIKDGQDILELGCGWGSLSLYLAQKYPNANIVAVSNSNSQREYIQSKAYRMNLSNLNIITADMNDFSINKKFDRIVSIEMFEHMRNYQELFFKINHFLKLNGKLFVHVFSHKQLSYKFEIKDSSDWMSKYFFTGGIMPGENLFTHFQDHLYIEKKWHFNGLHYQKTAKAWLHNMDKSKVEIMSIFEKTYGSNQAKRWWNYWRIFFMSCAELWGYRDGKEWSISHYLFSKQNSN